MNHEQTLEQLGIRFTESDSDCYVFSLLDILSLYKVSDVLWAFRFIHPRHILDRSPGTTDLNFVFLSEQGVYDLMDQLSMIEDDVDEVAERVKSLRAAVRGVCDEYEECLAAQYMPGVYQMQAKFLGLQK